MGRNICCRFPCTLSGVTELGETLSILTQGCLSPTLHLRHLNPHVAASLEAAGGPSLLSRGGRSGLPRRRQRDDGNGSGLPSDHSLGHGATAGGGRMGLQQQHQEAFGVSSFGAQGTNAHALLTMAEAEAPLKSETAAQPGSSRRLGRSVKALLRPQRHWVHPELHALIAAVSAVQLQKLPGVAGRTGVVFECPLDLPVLAYLWEAAAAGGSVPAAAGAGDGRGGGGGSTVHYLPNSALLLAAAAAVKLLLLLLPARRDRGTAYTGQLAGSGGSGSSPEDTALVLLTEVVCGPPVELTGMPGRPGHAVPRLRVTVDMAQGRLSVEAGGRRQLMAKVLHVAEVTEAAEAGGGDVSLDRLPPAVADEPAAASILDTVPEAEGVPPASPPAAKDKARASKLVLRQLLAPQFLLSFPKPPPGGAQPVAVVPYPSSGAEGYVDGVAPNLFEASLQLGLQQQLGALRWQPGGEGGDTEPLVAGRAAPAASMAGGGGHYYLSSARSVLVGAASSSSHMGAQLGERLHHHHVAVALQDDGHGGALMAVPPGRVTFGSLTVMTGGCGAGGGMMLHIGGAVMDPVSLGSAAPAADSSHAAAVQKSDEAAAQAADNPLLAMPPEELAMYLQVGRLGLRAEGWGCEEEGTRSVVLADGRPRPAYSNWHPCLSNKAPPP